MAVLPPGVTAVFRLNLGNNMHTEIKKQFPFFTAHPDVVYFDSASTALKPKSVIKEVVSYLAYNSFNSGRSNYRFANAVTKDIEVVRKKVASLINAHSTEEVIFTSGATQSLRMTAYDWGLNNLQDGDEILFCPEDHRSTVLPWTEVKDLLAKNGVIIKLIPFKIKPTGGVDVDDLVSKFNSRTKIILLTHIHNIYGVDSNIEEIRKRVGSETILSLDVSQSIGHAVVDVQKLGVDFASFSGHKMFADTGVGVLWMNKRITRILETGTLNISGVLSLGAAIDFVSEITIEKIHHHLVDLTQYLLKELKKIEGVIFLPGMAHCSCYDGYGIVSFTLRDIPAHDVSFMLDNQNICVRTGGHCQSNSCDKENSIRVSMHLYNDRADVDTLIAALSGIGE